MHIRNIRLIHEDYPTRDFYPFNLEIFQQTLSLPLTSPITFLMGENGTGKSTLLRAIADKSQIHIWESPQIRRIQQNPYEHLLHRAVELDWADGRVPGSYFGSQFFNHFTHLFEEWASADPGLIDYFGGHSLMTLSHGQSLLAFFESRYAIRGLYLLDEPETALSPTSQLKLVKLLQRAIAAGKAQFIIATHSPILSATPGAHIYNFDAAPIHTIDYQETEYYRFYKNFMNSPERFLS
jgi:predicted ATPase